MLLTAFTLVHVVISLVGILAGLVMLSGLLRGLQSERWTAIFFATTVATSVTGFFFPVARLLPSHIVGLISLVVLGLALHARYRRDLIGAWRPVYVIGATLALYLNVFVAVIQSFLKIPVLKSLAPTQTEPPFKLIQLAVLLLFVGLGTLALRRFRPAQRSAILVRKSQHSSP